MLIGLIGKTNTGKSTLFKALTLAEVEIENRPFVTIKPSHGIGFVKIKCVEEGFKVKCNPKGGYCLEGWRFVPVELLDVAGLVPGAGSEGRGLGSQFLDDLNEADALINIIDCSGGTDAEGNSVKPLSYDPSKDVEFLESELDHWYLRIIKRGWGEFTRKVRMENLNVKKAFGKQLSGLRVDEGMIEEAIKELRLSHNPASWSEDNLLSLASFLRKRSKPMIIAANKIDVEGARFEFKKLKDRFKEDIIIGCSAEAELALREAAKDNLIKYIPGEDNFEILEYDKLNEEQLKGLEFIKEKVLKANKGSGVQDILNYIVFNLLKNKAVYPVANAHLEDKDHNVLPDVHLMGEDARALDLAFKVHKDLGENFIKAVDLKSKRTIGKDYLLKDGDVVEIVSKK